MPDVSKPRPDFRRHFTEGVAHFNALRFWEAHESWETLWLVAATDLEQFLQGLIQLAAAYHHIRRGTWRGAVRLFDAALHRLDDFPLLYCGIDRTAAVEAAHEHRERVARSLQMGANAPFAESDYPKLVPVSVDVAPMPPFVQW